MTWRKGRGSSYAPIQEYTDKTLFHENEEFLFLKYNIKRIKTQARNVRRQPSSIYSEEMLFHSESMDSSYKLTRKIQAPQ